MATLSIEREIPFPHIILPVPLILIFTFTGPVGVGAGLAGARRELVARVERDDDDVVLVGCEELERDVDERDDDERPDWVDHQRVRSVQSFQRVCQEAKFHYSLVPPDRKFRRLYGRYTFM